MLKKSKLIVSLAILTIVATLFSGCFLFNSGDIKSISLESQPKTEYVQGEQFDTNFKVKVSYTDSSKEDVVLDYTNNQVEFENDFSSAAVGTYTCTISVKGQKGVTYSFSYSVVASGSVFTRGTGSKADPYVVTTAAQFAQIASESNKYYKLGNDIDLGVLRDDYYNKNTAAFELDGQNYAISIGGYCAYGFKQANNATIKNLVVNVKSDSHEAVLCLDLAGQCTFENITFNGTMEAESNTAMLACRTMAATKVTVKNCVNNVNFTGTAPYCAAFIGLIGSGNPEITFENCQNNGNFDAQSAFVYIANNASSVKSITVSGGSNTGKLVGAGVGLFNIDGNAAITARPTAADYAETSIKDKLTVNGFTADASKFVAVGTYKTANGKDVTLVNDNGTVKFNSELNLPAGYTVKAYVRDWISSTNSTTLYVFTQTMGTDFAAPYTCLTIVDGEAETPDGAISINDGKLKLANKIGSDTVEELTGKTEGANQYYCYFIYDATGAMKYCGAIKYADIQNA